MKEKNHSNKYTMLIEPRKSAVNKENQEKEKKKQKNEKRGWRNEKVRVNPPRGGARVTNTQQANLLKNLKKVLDRDKRAVVI